MTVPMRMLRGRAFFPGTVSWAMTIGTNIMVTASWATTAGATFITSSEVSCARTMTGTPTAPKAVGTLLAMRLTSAEKTGLNPRLMRIAAGMATAVPNPAIPSSSPPNPQVMSSTWMHLLEEMDENWALSTSIFPVCRSTL